MTSPPARLPVRCPCGSGDRFQACCGALHRDLADGGDGAPTAERLMRSRYSAFAVGDAGYLLATWHPSTRPRSLELSPDADWRQLEITATSGGGEADQEGTVAFVATFWEASERQFGQQREESVFTREAGRWLYVGPAD